MPYIDGRYYAPEDWLAIKTQPALEDVEPVNPFADGGMAAPPPKRTRSLSKAQQAKAAIADAMGTSLAEADGIDVTGNDVEVDEESNV
jgi:hypothetical protein